MQNFIKIIRQFIEITLNTSTGVELKIHAPWVKSENKKFEKSLGDFVKKVQAEFEGEVGVHWGVDNCGVMWVEITN